MLREKATLRNWELISRLLIQEFSLFFPTLAKQVRYITSLRGDELRDFVQAQWRHEKREKEAVVYELTKKEHLVQKYETSNCEFAQVFRTQSNSAANDVARVGLLGNLLLSEGLRTEDQRLVADEEEQSARKGLLDYLQHQLLESEAGNKLLEFLFLASLKMLVGDNKDSALFLKRLSGLFSEVFRLYETVLPRVKTAQLFALLPTVLMVIEVYHGSLVPLAPDQDIIASLVKIVESLQRPELSEYSSVLDDSEFEGISAATEKIYETSHPLERGKNINFPARKFPNASVLLLDLDKRCQSDPSDDTLTIQVVHEDSPVGNSIQVNDGVFSANLRLSGVVDCKKPHLMFGQAVTVDFNSSGQVKDTQSLVRYGFKFGLRPVFAGKVRLSEAKKQRLTTLFQSLANFECYFNTLKVAAVAISNTVENYLHLEAETADPRIEELLRCKIFKEGFEETPDRPDSQLADPIETVQKFMLSSEQESVDKTILRTSQQAYWTAREAPAKPGAAAEEELWNLEGVPLYIRTYLQQIREFKGDFIEVFIEARELAKEKGTYAQLMRRKTAREHKTLWLQGEAILFLTILKHSGLLHLNLKFSIEYIKENLRAFEDARDGIYNSFIARIQYVNEWRQLVETYLAKDNLPEPEELPPAEPRRGPVQAIAVKKKGGPSKTIRLGEKAEEKREEVKKGKSEEKQAAQRKASSGKF